MLNDSNYFQVDQLHAHGLAGLETAFDRMFPDTVPLTQSKIIRIKKLAKQLSSKRFQVRQKATEELITMGPPVRRYLAPFANNAALEIVRRAKVIMDTWGRLDDVADDLRGFARYIHGVHDADRIKLVSERVSVALECGMPKSSRREAIQLCLAAIVRSNWDGYSQHFEPLLSLRNVSVADFLLNEIGGHVRYSSHYPPLLIEALTSEHSRILEAATRWAPDCSERDAAAQVKQHLRRIFETNNEHLKFHVAFALMHRFGDRAAWEYILSQTQSHDPDRALTAACWIGDDCNRRKIGTPELIANLKPLLNHRDIALRMAAIQTLSKYRGELVAEALAPLLNEKGIIAEEAAIGLARALDWGRGRRRLYRVAGRQQIVAVRGERRTNVVESENEAESFLLTSIAANVESATAQRAIPRGQKSLTGIFLYGIRRELHAARAIACSGKRFLWFSFRTEDGVVRVRHAATAREAIIKAGRRYEALVRKIERLRGDFESKTTTTARQVMRAIDKTFTQCLFERGLIYLEEAQSYVEYQQNEQHNLRRARLIRNACETFKLVTQLDAENPICWRGVAWVICTSQMRHDHDLAHRLFVIIKKDGGSRSRRARAFAEYFFLAGLPYSPTFAKVSMVKKMRAKQSLCQEWLRNWFRYSETPFGCAVRYELAAAYYREATLLSESADGAHAQPGDTIKHRQALLQTAEKLSHEVAESRSEFAVDAARLCLRIRLQTERGRNVIEIEVDRDRVSN